MNKSGGLQGEGELALRNRLNEHLKVLVSRLVIPSSLSELISRENKQETKVFCQGLQDAAELLHEIDGEYEEHFIFLVERLEDDLRVKEGNILPAQILSLLELMLGMVFGGIRVRSYHIYRVIKYYQRTAKEEPSFFNAIVASYIRLCFEELITNYKHTAQLLQLSARHKAIPSSHKKLIRQDLHLGTIETACLLSMFINLFCRLNFPSLAAGVEQIFREEEAKAIYLDYLTALSRRIALERLVVSNRDLDILKVDVYGNLTILTKQISSERLLNKVVSLAKNLLRVTTDLRGINKLPVKLLAEKLAR